MIDGKLKELAELLLGHVEERRRQASQGYNRLIKEANNSDFPDQRKQAFDHADLFKNIEIEMSRLKVKMNETMKDFS